MQTLLSLPLAWTSRLLGRRSAAVAALAGLTVLGEAAFNLLPGLYGFALGGLVAVIAALCSWPARSYAQHRRRLGATGGGVGPNLETRHRIYQSQARVVWGDGRITPRERLFLEHLREELGLTLEDAFRLEQVHDLLEAHAVPTARPPQ